MASGYFHRENSDDSVDLEVYTQGSPVCVDDRIWQGMANLRISKQTWDILQARKIAENQNYWIVNGIYC